MTQPLLFQHARLIDGLADQPQENVSILVTGERISTVTKDPLALPAGAQVIDLGGKTVAPGLIDTHVHTMLTATHCVTCESCVSSLRFTVAASRTIHKRFLPVHRDQMLINLTKTLIKAKEAVCVFSTP
jgi:predicted amidohydrolase